MKRPEQHAGPARASLSEMALVFLRLGFTAFGGPAGHIAMMEDEVVRRRSWLTREEFVDLIGAVNLIPGPNSTELGLHIGLRRAGWAGFFTVGACFVLPSAVMVLVMAWSYAHFGTLPEAAGVLYGTKPVIIAIVVQALGSLARTAVKTRFLAAIGVLATIAGFLGVHSLLLLLVCGLVVGAAVAFLRGTPAEKHMPSAMLGLLSGATTLPVAAASATSASLGALFLYFLRIGAVLFGSGYLLLAFVHDDLVVRWHWLTESQLLDAIAVSQVTPGPLSTAATFIGYLLGGVKGALVATLGIFLPGFVLVGVSGRLVPRLRQSRVAGAFLDGVNVAALALMVMVAWQLGRAALVDLTTAGLAAASLLLLWRYRVNSVWLVLGGA
ncbi:MAG TPA: chromate efflux transporter, partial [Candidatus Acidoferrales bacterium]|nr:chromate efflux transporter [Candidatus Acidoferrales bacterium]